MVVSLLAANLNLMCSTLDLPSNRSSKRHNSNQTTGIEAHIETKEDTQIQNREDVKKQCIVSLG
jgi:hypothetical protein